MDYLVVQAPSNTNRIFIPPLRLVVVFLLSGVDLTSRDDALLVFNLGSSSCSSALQLLADSLAAVVMVVVVHQGRL